MSDKREKPKTHPHTLPDGRTVRVTIPPAPTAEEQLEDALLTLREELAPETVAVVASMLKLARTDDENVNRQVGWLAGKLTAMVGGDDRRVKLVDGIFLRQVAR